MLWRTSWTGVNSPSLTKRAMCPRLPWQDKDSHPPSCSALRDTTLGQCRAPSMGQTHKLGQTQRWWPKCSGLEHTGCEQRPQPCPSRGAQERDGQSIKNKGISISHGPRRMVQHCSSRHSHHTPGPGSPGTSCHLLSPDRLWPRGGAGHTWPWHPTWGSTPPTFVSKNGFKFCWSMWDIKEHKPKTLSHHSLTIHLPKSNLCRASSIIWDTWFHTQAWDGWHY